MVTISLAMIVKNEQDVLERCLDNAKNLFDEIIIVDTGSTDATKQIAKRFTPRVQDFEWVNDFSRARNYAFSLATCDYVMWLDADDILSNSLQENIPKLKSLLTSQNPDVVMMKYDVAFDEDNNPTFSYYRERIIKNNVGFVWEDAVHEVISPKGKIVYFDYSIEHRPKPNRKQTDRNLKIYESLIDSGITLSARGQYYYSRELMFNGKYTQAVANFNKFLLRPDAWKENLISACLDLGFLYIKLGENQKAKLSLLNSFAYDTPRAEACCKLGDIFMNEKKYKEAIYWFNMALKDKANLHSGAFVQTQYYNIYPLLQLCVCHYHLGHYKKAQNFNDKVGKINKNNSAYKSNKIFFEKLINNK